MYFEYIPKKKGKRRMKSHDNFIDFTMTTKKGELE